MPYRKNNIWKSIDWWSISIYLILVIIGWFSIYASSYDFDQVSIFDLSGRAGMQMIWIIISLVLGFSLLLIESDWYDIFAYWIYFFIILLLVITIIIPHNIRGSHSWLIMGPIRFQPAEFAKFATTLAIAKLINSYKFDLSDLKNFIKLLAFIFLPMVLIFMQKETGSALVFFALFFVLYREGMPGSILFAGFCAILFFVIDIRYGNVQWGITEMGKLIVLLFIIISSILWIYTYKKGRSNVKYLFFLSLIPLVIAYIISLFLPFDLCLAASAAIVLTVCFLLIIFIRYKASIYLHVALFSIISVAYLYSTDYVFNELLEPHQKVRIEVSLGIIDDPSGAGYNVNQSKIAIGSGGVFGKGYLNGTQTKLKYVPEQDTDFIFCTIGEEKGFIGSTSVLLLFGILVVRIIFLSERQKSIFSRVYGYGVASILFFHLVINIGMVIGLTPVIGIPLPFFSYGGSSLLAFSTLLVIFLRLDAGRNERL
ncbi:MAG: rod shape-determining protein RodA [Dysgonamonadaceae bacterium]|nr:rod shape-determining protein RodA [Dysgonamonadaceae bacterium]